MNIIKSDIQPAIEKALVGKRVKEQSNLIARVESVTPNGLACSCAWLNVLGIKIGESLEPTDSLSVITYYSDPYLHHWELPAMKKFVNLTRTIEGAETRITTIYGMSEVVEQFKSLIGHGLITCTPRGRDVLKREHYILQGQSLLYTLYDLNKFRLQP